MELEDICAKWNKMAADWARGNPPDLLSPKDFRELKEGGKRTGRYVYRSDPDGPSISRRKRDELVLGGVLDEPAEERRQRFIDAYQDAEFRLCFSFKGMVKSTSGKDSRNRERKVEEEEIDERGEEWLEEAMAAWAEGDCESAGNAWGHAMITSWWDRGDGEITDLDSMAVHMCGEE